MTNTIKVDKDTITVNAQALREVLQALIGPPHLIRELQATMNPIFENPITTLVNTYSKWVDAVNKEYPN